MLNTILNMIDRIQEAVEDFIIGRWVAFYSPFRVRTS